MPTDEPWSISADLAHDGTVECVLLKVGCALFEANFWIPLQDLAKLKEVRSRPWAERSSAIGRSAGVLVFWSFDAGQVSVLIGQDDETWDVGLTLPDHVFAEILAEIDLCLKSA